MTLREWQRRCYEAAKAKGWHTKAPEPADLGRFLMNLHSEVTEAWEEYRRGYAPTETYYTGRHDDPALKPEGVPTELADVFIRLMDTAEAFGIDLEAAVERKMAYNATRPHRHGGKLA